MKPVHRRGTLGCVSSHSIQQPPRTSHTHGPFNGISASHLLRIERSRGFESPDTLICPTSIIPKPIGNSSITCEWSGSPRFGSVGLALRTRPQWHAGSSSAWKQFTTQTCRGKPSPHRPPPSRSAPPPVRTAPPRAAPSVGSRPRSPIRTSFKGTDDDDDEILAVSSQVIEQQAQAKIAELRQQASFVKIAEQQKELENQERRRKEQSEEEATLWHIENQKRRARELEARAIEEERKRREAHLMRLWQLYHEEHIEPVRKSLRVLEENDAVIFKDLWQHRLMPLVIKFDDYMQAMTVVTEQVHRYGVQTRQALRHKDRSSTSILLRVESAIAVVEYLKASSGRHATMVAISKLIQKHARALTEAISLLCQSLRPSHLRLLIEILGQDMNAFSRFWAPSAHAYRTLHRLSWVDTIYPGIFRHENLSSKLLSSLKDLTGLDMEIDSIFVKLKILRRFRGKRFEWYRPAFSYVIEMSRHINELAPGGMYLHRDMENNPSQLQFFYNTLPIGLYKASMLGTNSEFEILLKSARSEVQEQLLHINSVSYVVGRQIVRFSNLFMMYHYARLQLEGINNVSITQSCRRMVYDQYLQLDAPRRLRDGFDMGVAAGGSAHNKVGQVIGDGLYYPSAPWLSIPVEFIHDDLNARARLLMLSTNTIAGVHLHLSDPNDVRTKNFAYLVIATLDRLSIISLNQKLDWHDTVSDFFNLAFRRFWQERALPNLKIVSGFDQARRLLESLGIQSQNVIEIPMQAVESMPHNPTKPNFTLPQKLGDIYDMAEQNAGFSWITHLVYQALLNLYIFLTAEQATDPNIINSALRTLLESQKHQFRRMFECDTKAPSLGPVIISDRPWTNVPSISQRLRLQYQSKHELNAVSMRAASNFLRQGPAHGTCVDSKDISHTSMCLQRYFKFTTFGQQSKLGTYSGTPAREILYVAAKYNLRLNEEDKDILRNQAEKEAKTTRRDRRQRLRQQEEFERQQQRAGQAARQSQYQQGDTEPMIAFETFSSLHELADDMLDHAEVDQLTDTSASKEDSTLEGLRVNDVFATKLEAPDGLPQSSLPSSNPLIRLCPQREPSISVSGGGSAIKETAAIRSVLRQRTTATSKATAPSNSLSKARVAPSKPDLPHTSTDSIDSSTKSFVPMRGVSYPRPTGQAENVKGFIPDRPSGSKSPTQPQSSPSSSSSKGREV